MDSPYVFIALEFFALVALCAVLASLITRHTKLVERHMALTNRVRKLERWYQPLGSPRREEDDELLQVPEADVLPFERKTKGEGHERDRRPGFRLYHR